MAKLNTVFMALLQVGNTKICLQVMLGSHENFSSLGNFSFWLCLYYENGKSVLDIGDKTAKSVNKRNSGR